MCTAVLPVGGMLRPAGRGIFPVLLAPVGGEVEDVVDEQEPVHAASGGGVGPVDVLAVTQEHAEHEEAPPPSAPCRPRSGRAACWTRSPSSLRLRPAWAGRRRC